MHGYTEFSDVSRFDLPGKTNDADAVVCISDYARSQIMMLCEPERWPRLHIVHCGVDVGEFTPVEPSTEPHPLRLLFLGRLVSGEGAGGPGRGPRPASCQRGGCSAHHRRRGACPSCRSSGPSVSWASPSTWSSSGAVPPSEARNYYHRADVFCLPSFAEGVPVVLMEAMSCELPVVTTYVTGIPELVTDGVDGFTVTPGRADRLADALRALTDPERRHEMGVIGRKKVASEFDLTTVGPQLLAVFEPLPGT